MRELLDAPAPWSARQRQIWRDVVVAEHFEVVFRRHEEALADAVSLDIERQRFRGLLGSGYSVETALRMASEQAAKAVATPASEGAKARKRRRLQRDAREALDARAVTKLGMVQACIVCEKRLPWGRRDRAYCSDACRQRAYRKRQRSA
jgi:hypothetical protein